MKKHILALLLAAAMLFGMLPGSIAAPAFAEEEVLTEPGQITEEITQPAAEETVTQEPVTEEPAAEEPAEETPAEETPAEEVPAEETPAEETPAEEVPAEAEPAEETPAEEEPAEEEPAEEEPAQEEPAEEEPAEVEPAEEEPAAEESAAEEPAEEEPAAEEGDAFSAPEPKPLEIVITADKTGPLMAEESVEYTVYITNKSDTVLKKLAVYDSVTNALEKEADQLKPEEILQFSISRTVSREDMLSGKTGLSLRAMAENLNDDDVFAASSLAAVSPAKVNISASKILEGRSLNEGEFFFNLCDTNCVVKNASNAADGSISFGELVFFSEGEYSYTVTEAEGSLPGVFYDDSEYTVNVSVSYDGRGALTASVTGDEEIEFYNFYMSMPVTLNFEGSKHLEGRELEANEFEFALYSQSGRLLETVSNSEDGSFAFNLITYTNPGVYYYTVKEVRGSDPAVIYDETVYRLTVTVTDDLMGNLVAEVSGDSSTGKDLSFTNSCRAGNLKIWNTVSGDNADTERYFSFKVEFDAEGSYSFEGAYSGTIKSGDVIRLRHNEAVIISGLPAGISYTVTGMYAEGYKLSYMGAEGTIASNDTVTARFFNFSGSTIPKTGDDSNLLLWSVLLAVSVCGAASCMFMLKKRREE